MAYHDPLGGTLIFSQTVARQSDATLSPMSGDLITDQQLADEFGMDLDTFHRRRDHGWPCVKFDCTTFRFTPEQREQIIAMQTVGGRTVEPSRRGRRQS